MSFHKKFRCIQRMRVRWSEVDPQSVVFNSHYQMYLSTVMSDYWRALAMPYEPTMAFLGGDLYLRRSSLEYLGSARFDDIISVGLRCDHVGNSSVRFECAIQRGDESLVTGELMWVYADRQTQRSATVPPGLRAAYARYEGGESMIELRSGGWDVLGPDARPIRSQVFIDEQRVPAEMEWDEADATCLHAVAYNCLGMPLGTGRLLQHAAGVARIGRMAVIPAMRGSQVGSHLLQALMKAAKDRGDREVLLHAQCSAEGFYRRAGFMPRGAVFDEAGIDHIEMVRAL